MISGCHNTEPQTFYRVVSKVSGFLTVCKLFIKMKMREIAVEEQIQWVLLYIQGGLVDIWKKNILEDLKTGNLEYNIFKKFLADLKKEFGEEEEEETIKVVELKKVEQGSRTIK